MTTREEISDWFTNSINAEMKYLLVYCDTFDWSDYPVYAKNIIEFWKVYDNPMYSENNLQKLMEVYDLSLNKDFQLSESRARHFPPREMR